MVRRGGADPGRDRTQKECCRVPRLRISGSRKRILSVESFPLSNAHETLVRRSASNAGRGAERCPSARWSDGSAASSRQHRHSVAGAYASRCSAPSANTGQRHPQPAAVERGTTGLVAGTVHAVGSDRRHCLYIYVRTASGYPGYRPRCLGRAVSLGASRAATSGLRSRQTLARRSRRGSSRSTSSRTTACSRAGKPQGAAVDAAVHAHRPQVG